MPRSSTSTKKRISFIAVFRAEEKRISSSPNGNEERIPLSTKNGKPSE